MSEHIHPKGVSDNFQFTNIQTCFVNEMWR